ncbi:Uncharacterized protein Fot_32618 [Forsythia ovata]|uniref:Uncharacterized protein n=1 Tax=Forsythia ovata TaxID=205694 RepID=A0ABD1T8B9_9LAMI
MAFQPKLIPDISPGQTSWTSKVVVAEKNISRTAQRSPVKYQNMVLVDPQENQSVAQSIRTSIDDEHILYVRATERNVDGIHVKYDVVFLIDTVTELDTTMHPETSSDVIPGFRGNSFSRCRKGKQIVKPIKRALFSLKDSDSSQDEEHECLTDNIIPSQLGENTEHSVVGDFSEEDDIPVQQQ